MQKHGRNISCSKRYVKTVEIILITASVRVLIVMKSLSASVALDNIQ